jgi:16S rRNA (guanine966-N2)-methyltransferase
MRIISGEAGRRRFFLPKGCSIRPTSDRVKEALFNILHPVSGQSFLDLFAGSGNVGFEALSRGASRVVFVEQNVVLANAIRENLTAFGFRERCITLAMGVGRGIQELAVRGERFDILFADPPYEKKMIEETLLYLEDGKLLLDDAVIVLQHSVRETLPKSLSNRYILTDQRKYGYTGLSFLKLAAGE